MTQASGKTTECTLCATLQHEVDMAHTYKQSAYATQTNESWDELLLACSNPTLALQLRHHYYWYRAQLTYNQKLVDLLQHEQVCQVRRV
jgi:hypothetical protein